MDLFYLLIQNTYISMTVLLIVALGGLLSERSGVTNIALEGIMILGAFLGVWAIHGLEMMPYSLITRFVILVVMIIFVGSVLLLIHFVLSKFGIKHFGLSKLNLGKHEKTMTKNVCRRAAAHRLNIGPACQPAGCQAGPRRPAGGMAPASRRQVLTTERHSCSRLTNSWSETA